MTEQTKIRWATSTWNPWYGCKKVSQGCKHCYMFRDMKRYGRDPNKVLRAQPATFNQPLKWAKNGKVKKGSQIFTCSWSDWFIEDADPWRDEAWKIVRDTPFTYMILTKRPERIADHLPDDWGLRGYPNVWLGVSAEDQENADKRIPILMNTPAAVRFVSAEPLLGPIDFRHIVYARSVMGDNEFVLDAFSWQTLTNYDVDVDMQRIDWVITGGESGPGCRPAQMDWFRQIRDNCTETAVAFFHKQMGGTRKIDGEWGGYLLDGHEWSEFPEVVTA